MNHSQKTFALAQLVVRHFSKTAVRNSEVVSPKFQKLKEIQKKFGVEDNVPVYLKGGLGDKMLYATTVVLTTIGLGMSLQTYYVLANK